MEEKKLKWLKGFESLTGLNCRRLVGRQDGHGACKLVV